MAIVWNRDDYRFSRMDYLLDRIKQLREHFEHQHHVDTAQKRDPATPIRPERPKARGKK
jgi:hypothetical protein